MSQLRHLKVPVHCSAGDVATRNLSPPGRLRPQLRRISPWPSARRNQAMRRSQLSQLRHFQVPDAKGGKGTRRSVSGPCPAPPCVCPGTEPRLKRTLPRLRNARTRNVRSCDTWRRRSAAAPGMLPRGILRRESSTAPDFAGQDCRYERDGARSSSAGDLFGAARIKDATEETAQDADLRQAKARTAVPFQAGPFEGLASTERTGVAAATLSLDRANV